MTNDLIDQAHKSLMLSSMGDFDGDAPALKWGQWRREVARALVNDDSEYLMVLLREQDERLNRG